MGSVSLITKAAGTARLGVTVLERQQRLAVLRQERCEVHQLGDVVREGFSRSRDGDATHRMADHDGLAIDASQGFPDPVDVVLQGHLGWRHRIFAVTR